jgi:hypothetical protein
MNVDERASGGDSNVNGVLEPGERVTVDPAWTNPQPATALPLMGSVLASDARRIVAAVNDTQGIPTAALEAGFIRDLLELKVRPRSLWEKHGPRLQVVNSADAFLYDPLDAPAPFAFERRVGERRRGDRRRG